MFTLSKFTYCDTITEGSSSPESHHRQSGRFGELRPLGEVCVGCALGPVRGEARRSAASGKPPLFSAGRLTSSSVVEPMIARNSIAKAREAQDSRSTLRAESTRQ
jgi:hypothetical protein